MKCAEQDYVELACLFNMPVLIRLQDGSEIKGTAKDTNYNKQKQECIVLHSAEGDCSIALNLIVLMQTHISARSSFQSHWPLKITPSKTLVAF